MIPYHVGDLQIFEVDRVVLAQQPERRLVVEVEPLAFDVLMRPLKQPNGLASAVAALLAAGDDPLRFLQALLTTAMQARILHHGAIRRDEKDLQSDINTRLASRGWKWLHWHIGARENGVPAVRFVRESDGLGRAC